MIFLLFSAELLSLFRHSSSSSAGLLGFVGSFYQSFSQLCAEINDPPLLPLFLLLLLLPVDCQRKGFQRWTLCQSAPTVTGVRVCCHPGMINWSGLFVSDVVVKWRKPWRRCGCLCCSYWCSSCFWSKVQYKSRSPSSFCHFSDTAHLRRSSSWSNRKPWIFAFRSFASDGISVADCRLERNSLLTYSALRPSGRIYSQSKKKSSSEGRFGPMRSKVSPTAPIWPQDVTSGPDYFVIITVRNVFVVVQKDQSVVRNRWCVSEEVIWFLLFWDVFMKLEFEKGFFFFFKLQSIFLRAKPVFVFF